MSDQSRVRVSYTDLRGRLRSLWEALQSFQPRSIDSSLSERSYRLYFTGQLISVVGSFVQTVALAFLVLHLTGSGTALGLVIATLWLPIFFFSPFGGLLADRLDKRNILYVTQTLLVLLAGAFAVLIATGVIAMWMVYLLALGVGGVNAVDLPTRQSFIAEMVPLDKLENAITLNSISVNIARVFGAALGGVIVAFLGLATCFSLNAASFVAVLITLMMMRRAQLHPAPRVVRQKGQIRAGLRYVRTVPQLLVPMIMIAVIGVLAYEFPVTLPLMATDTFHRGAGTYGLMASVMSGGAVLGGVVTASRERPRARALALAAIGWGIAISAAAVAPSLPLELLALAFVGYGTITFNAMAKTTLQLASIPVMRGRVMALWVLAWGGTTLIGGPLVGWIAQEFGARWPLLVGGVPTVLVGIVAWPALKRIDQHAEPPVR
jgi:MFS family permease